MSRPPRILSERQGSWLLTFYPPLLFQRIRVRFADDFRTCHARVRHSRLTRNLHGTTFGGSIFAAADPIASIMYWQIFARRGMRVQTWLRSASIRYLRPAASDLTLELRVSEEEIEQAASSLEREGRFARTYTIEARDREGTVCAVVETEVYGRQRSAGEPVDSTF